jgi:hypothetical protein
MFDTLKSLPAIGTSAPATPFPVFSDDNALLSAATRWEDSRRQMASLIRSTPSVHAAVMDLLREKLDLKGDQVGLLFYGNDQRTSRRCTLAEALVFMAQNPHLDLAQIPECRLNGLPADHPRSSRPVVQLLEELKALNLRHALTRRWIRHWDRRSPGTSVSRIQHALQLYRSHFTAACLGARGERLLDSEQLEVLMAVLDPPQGEFKVNGHQVYCEQLALKIGTDRLHRLPGALVVTHDATHPTVQMLYLPRHQPALRLFDDRVEMERWLIKQQRSVFAISESDAHTRIDYTRQSDPLTAGIQHLFLHWQDAQIQSAFEGMGSDIAEHAASALSNANQWDAQHRQSAFFAEAPGIPAGFADTSQDMTLPGHGDDSLDGPPLFGSLSADLSLRSRKAAIDYQHGAMLRLLGEDYDGDLNDDRLSSLKALFDELETQVKASSTAADALLNRKTVLDFATINTQYTALYQARLKGLRAEIDLQLKLQQLSTDEHRLVAAVLDAKEHVGWPGDIRVATITLLAQSTDAGVYNLQSKILEGALVFMSGNALDDADAGAGASHLLYWPGSDGGVQRFTSRKHLEQTLYGSDEPDDPRLSLRLTTVHTDPFELSLQTQYTRFEELAADLRTAHAGDAQELEREQALGLLREKSYFQLLVPDHAARRLAFNQFTEVNKATALVSELPAWVGRISPEHRVQLKSLLDAYFPALERADKLRERQLPLPVDFSLQRVEERLRKDFALEHPFRVTLDLPDSVTVTQQPVEGGAPGTPTRRLDIPSHSRSKLSIQQLALLNVVPPMGLRLGFMKVEIATEHATERDKLQAGITGEYLVNIVKELDVAAKYQALIQDTYLGTGPDSQFEREYRRECLLEPYQLLLKIHGLSARLQGRINATEQQMFETATQATTASAWNANGQQLVMLAASLSLSGTDTLERPSTLSGINFIEDQISGTTLLYLPDSPDHKFLRRYDNLEAARKALFNLCLSNEMIEYLADRALKGDRARHKARIIQAVVNNFDGLIEVGTPWPSHTSLATHLLDTEMGRVIVAHQQSSTSNSDLYLQAQAVKAEQVFTYMKMAFSLVPFIGLTIAVYDIWTNLNAAVAAFRKGNALQGLEALNGAMLAFIDGMMDWVSGVSIKKALARLSSLLRSQQRQLLRLSTRIAQARKTRHLAARFDGYAHPGEISLAGLPVASEGLYRNVYRHADGDFILREGKLYKVQLDTDKRFWRLSETATKKYKQPVALDENGNWDTYFGVYGRAIEGGGAGGGGALGRLADTLDPIWPESIRERLPTWWRDRNLRQQLRLKEDSNRYSRQFNRRSSSINAAIDEYNAASVQRRPALRPALEAACTADIESGSRHYRILDELQALERGHNKRQTIAMRSDAAQLVADRFKLRIYYLNHKSTSLMDDIEGLLDLLDQLPEIAVKQRQSTLEQIRTLRLQVIRDLDQINELFASFDLWYKRITSADGQKALRPEHTDMASRFNTFNMLYLKTGYLMDVFSRFDSVTDVSWFYLQQQSRSLRAKVDRALYNQYLLAEGGVQGRNQVLQNCVDLYTEFRRELRVWTTSYPHHFHMESVEQLMDGIEKMLDRARKGIDLPTLPTPAGQARKKVFTTEDGLVLFGVEEWVATTQTRRYRLTGKAGIEEIWEQAADGKFRQLNAPTSVLEAPLDLPSLVADARKRLDALPTYQSKVQSYAKQDMLPVDLEHMLVSEADELTRRALRIEQMDGANPVIKTLRDKAAELKTTGRTLRTEQSLSSKKPTDGMLDDLVRHDAVEIRKPAEVKNLGKRKDGRSDYLQEYEVWDLQSNPQKLVWYAHFHYTSANPVFRQFEKAHLKLPEHRFLTHADNADLPYADIGKRSAALDHFDNL